MAAKMHAGEVATNETLVRALIATQFPQWVHLPITPVASAGTDNALYRLGRDLVVRLPRIHWASDQPDKEVRWLPQLAPHLPLAIPVPVAKGDPGEGYPWHWSVTGWLEGENARLDRLTDPRQAATDLAQFVTALQQIDASRGPRAGAYNSDRGVPLAERDSRVRAAISALAGKLDVPAVMAVWEDALAAPAWSGPPVWIHGDLQPGNLLAQQGRLSGVIDFGCLGVGDPACDLIAAWNFFDADTRTVFRATLSADDATWARGRGWALSIALIALPYYLETNPAIVAASWRTLAEVLAG